MRKNWRTKLWALAFIPLFLCGCSSQKTITREEAIAMLKEFTIKVNYTSSFERPTAYSFSETDSSLIDSNTTVSSATLTKRLDETNHYAYYRVDGTANDKPYVNERWIFVSDKKIMTLTHLAAYLNETSTNDRARSDDDYSETNWEEIAKSDLADMRTLIGSSASETASFLENLENESSSEENSTLQESYTSSGDGNLSCYVSQDNATRSETFSDYLVTDFSFQDENDKKSSTVKWGSCNLSTPSISDYPLSSE